MEPAKEGTFVLFPNKKRREGKQDPHWTGQTTIAGVQYWLSAWDKKSKIGGNPFMNGTLKVKIETAENTPPARSADNADGVAGVHAQNAGDPPPPTPPVLNEGEDGAPVLPW